MGAVKDGEGERTVSDAVPGVDFFSLSDLLLTAGYSVENAFGQSLRELRLMFPGGGAMLEALQEMVLRAENNQRPEQLLKDLAEKASAGRSREFRGSILYGKNKRWKPECNYPSDSRADGAGDGYQKGDLDISGGKSI